MLFGQDHVKRYIETGGAEGHDWNGTQTLILTTTGRVSGQPRPNPLIYGESEGAYIVVASKGGAPEHPAWYRNLVEHPEVEVQVGADRFRAHARTATPEEKKRLWPLMLGHWAPYDEYQRKTQRDIPVVILEPIR